MRKVGVVLAGLLALVLLTGCQPSGEQMEETEQAAPAPEQWTVKGKIVSIDTENNQVTIDHEAIPGLMEAMSMAFALGDPALVEGISEGDEVEFVLERKEGVLTVTKITKSEEMTPTGEE